MIKALTSAPKTELIHSGNKPGVIKRLLKIYTNSIGLIDEDPSKSQPRSLQKFQEIDSNETHEIKLLFHPNTNNHLIVIRPRLEEWILKAARLANIDVRDYNLPNDPYWFKKFINLNLDKFEKLLNNLMGISKRLEFLSNLLLIRAPI